MSLISPLARTQGGQGGACFKESKGRVAGMNVDDLIGDVRFLDPVRVRPLSSSPVSKVHPRGHPARAPTRWTQRWHDTVSSADISWLTLSASPLSACPLLQASATGMGSVVGRGADGLRALRILPQPCRRPEQQQPAADQAAAATAAWNVAVSDDLPFLGEAADLGLGGGEAEEEEEA